jgi:hypothetical protein
VETEQILSCLGEGQRFGEAAYLVGAAERGVIAAKGITLT